MESVACSLAKRGSHLLTICVGTSGDLIHVKSECESTSMARESVERLGGECCATHVEQVLQTLKEQPNHSDTGNYRNSFYALPDLAQTVMKRCRGVADEKRRDRKTIEASGTDPLARSEIAARESDHEMHTKLLCARALKIVSAKASKVAGLHINFARGDGVWTMAVGLTMIGKREVGKRGWQFDEFKLRETLRRETLYFFAANASGRQAHTEGENTHCLACAKQVKNRSSHIKTNKHVDKVLDRSRLAMRTFGGPRRK